MLDVSVLRNMSFEDFILNFGSGTLSKSYKLGMNVNDEYFAQRVRFEFGNSFEILHSSRITYSALKLTPCFPLTELGWHAERMIELRNFEEDVFKVKYLTAEYPDGTIKEGAGIIVQTPAPWLPKGVFIFAFVSLKVNGVFQEAINPF